MNWAIFFRDLKNDKIASFKSPSFLTKPKNRTKLEYIFKRPFIFTKTEYGFDVSDNSFYRTLEKDSFISFNYKDYTDRENNFNLSIKLIDGTEKTLQANSNDNILIYYTEADVIFFLNYNIQFSVPYDSIDNMVLQGTKNKIIEIDYIKEYLESIEINVFSFVESLLKKINDELSDFYTFDDYNFISYILNYKPTTIEQFVNFSKPELLNTFLEMKGSYKDLELIKKIGLFEKILFKDENSNYTNFINYFLNIVPENYEFIVETFMKNYNLYQKFQDNFKCIIKPKDSYYLVDWDQLLMAKCSYINVNGNYIEGLYFVNEIIGDKIKFSVDNIYLDNLEKRYIEILTDVKNYLDFLKELQTQDFNQIQLVIDNNANIKINNNNTFLIPGQEINLSDLKLDGSQKECYLDYAIRLNLDDNKQIIKFNENLNILKNILKERMPFLLRVYFEYLDALLESTYDLNEKINEYFEIDIDLETFESYDYTQRLDELNEFDFYFEPVETFEKLDEEFGFRVESKTDPYSMKILGTGVIDTNNFKVMGYLTNDGKVELKGSTFDDVLPYTNLSVGRYCFIGNKVADVYVTFDTPHSEKYKGYKNLVKCRYDDLYEYYQNNVIKITDTYFKYINNTENILEFNELLNLPLESGIYTIKNKFHEIEPYYNSEWKIIGTGIVYNDATYVVDIKEQIFKGKPNNKIIAREYVINITDDTDEKTKEMFPEYEIFGTGLYYIKNNNYIIDNYFVDNWGIIGGRIVENNETYIIVPLDETDYNETINAREYINKIK